MFEPDYNDMFFIPGDTGLKKVPSHCPTQVDIPSEQVTFHSHLPDRQGIRRVTYLLKHKKEQTKTFPAKFVSFLSQGQAGIEVFFLSPFG